MLSVTIQRPRFTREYRAALLGGHSIDLDLGFHRIIYPDGDTRVRPYDTNKDKLVQHVIDFLLATLPHDGGLSPMEQMVAETLVFGDAVSSSDAGGGNNFLTPIDANLSADYNSSDLRGGLSEAERKAFKNLAHKLRFALLNNQNTVHNGTPFTNPREDSSLQDLFLLAGVIGEEAKAWQGKDALNGRDIPQSEYIRKHVADLLSDDQLLKSRHARNIVDAIQAGFLSSGKTVLEERVMNALESCSKAPTVLVMGLSGGGKSALMAHMNALHTSMLQQMM